MLDRGSASNQCPVRAALLGFQHARIDAILTAGEPPAAEGSAAAVAGEGHGDLDGVDVTYSSYRPGSRSSWPLNAGCAAEIRSGEGDGEGYVGQ
jgi:hypothetical protein